jgi:hypothetical protein
MSVPMGAKEICAESIDWLVSNGLLPRFEKSGPFVAGVRGYGKGSLDDRKFELVHYETFGGPLYADSACWRRAALIVDAFTIERRESAGADNWLVIDDPFGRLRAIPSVDLLDHLQSAMAAAGFQLADRLDATGTARFRVEERCTVADLPEPYGKWLQRAGRPQWQDGRTARVELGCRTASFATADGEFETGLELRLSAPACPLVERLLRSLAAALRSPNLDDGRAQRRLTRRLRQAAEDYAGPLNDGRPR